MAKEVFLSRKVATVCSTSGCFATAEVLFVLSRSAADAVGHRACGAAESVMGLHGGEINWRKNDDKRSADFLLVFSAKTVNCSSRV